ncbi:MAG: hypothetical protein ACXADS_16555 [Candidatus Thorarchaeota archaeon]
MTIAELRGKLSSEVTRKEDLLTSSVFGTLKNIDRQVGLGGFLNLVGIELAPDELENAEFRFWEKMPDRTEPDVSIRTASTLIFIEAKYLGSLGADPTQLRREFERGRELAQPGLTFHLIAVTAGPVRPDTLESFCETLSPQDRSKVHWVSWQMIALLMEQVLSDQRTDVVSRRCAEDLYRLLEHKNLRGFRGFTMLTDADLSQIVSQQEAFAGEVANLIVELRAILKDQGIIPLRSRRNMIERDGRSMSVDAPKDWVLTYYAYPMVDTRWAEQGLSDASLILKIFLDTAELGILCAVQMDRNTPGDLHQMAESDAVGWCSDFRDDYFGELPFLEGAPVQQSDALAEWGGWLAAYQKYPLSSFQDRSSVEMIAKEVIRFRDMVPLLVEWIIANQDNLLNTGENGLST